MKHRTRYSFGEFRVHTLRETVADVSVDNPRQIFDYWQQHIAPSQQMHLPDKEHLVVVLLDAKGRALGWHLVAMGSLVSCDAHPREILRPALVGAAYGFVMMHNHPSGECCPSDPDRRLTRRIKEAAEIMGLHFAEHLIIGREMPHQPVPFFSFREHGLI